METIIHQIDAIIKNIIAIFDSTLLPPVVAILKSIAGLLVSILELGINAIRWIVAKF